MKIKLTKDPSHKGYYVDENGNLYVFRFGGRPIRVDGYRDELPKETGIGDSIDIDEKSVIEHGKKASNLDNLEYLNELDREIKSNDRRKNMYPESSEEYKKIQKTNDGLIEEKMSTSTKTNFDSKNEQSIQEIRKAMDSATGPDVIDTRSGQMYKEVGNGQYRSYKDGYDYYLDDKYIQNTTDKDLRNNLDDKARNIIKKQTGQREMYQSIAKLMNDNEDKLSSEEWKALDKARMILKQNPELIADDSVLSDTSKPIHERLSKYMNDNEYKLDSGVWGPLYEANQELRKHDTAEITKLKDRYQKTQGVSDDWFIEEGRKLGMKDEDIADAIYIKKGAEAQGSTDDNIKRIIANTEKQHYERLIKEYKDAINDPKTGEWDREFMKSELPGLENKAEMFANYEAEFIKRVNRDDEVFTVKYRDDDFVENFKAIGLDEAFALQEQFQKYTDDVMIYDADGKEIQYDKDRKHYSTPTYEENKKKFLRNTYRNNLYGADRSNLVSMVHNLGLNWNVERFTTQQLYRMLEKELNKK